MLTTFTTDFKGKHEGFYLFLAQLVGKRLDNGLGPLAVYFLPLGLSDDNTVFPGGVIEKICDVNIQGIGDIFQRGNRRRPLPQLKLRKEAGREAGLFSEVPKRKPGILSELLDFVAEINNLVGMIFY